MYLLMLAACWTPKETTPTGMVGRVLDADGAPVAGITVESEEARDVTDASGTFAVSYKSPTQLVYFDRGDVHYVRRFQPGVDRGVVELRLPPIAARTISCEMDTTCEARLTWDLGGGLEAVSRARCDTTEPTIAIEAPPTGAPTRATCAPPTGPEQTLEVHPSSPLRPPDHVRLTPAWVSLRARLTTDDPDLPSACQVYADDQPARLDDENRWTAPAWGRTQLHAVCDGVPGAPHMVVVRNEGDTELAWSRATPTLDARAAAPGSTRLRVVKLTGMDQDWTLDLAAQPDGTFVLPRLAPGLFALGFGATVADLRALHAAEDLAPGVLHLTDVPDAAGQPLRVGLLRVTSPIDGGAVPIAVTPARPTP